MVGVVGRRTNGGSNAKFPRSDLTACLGLAIVGASGPHVSCPVKVPWVEEIPTGRSDVGEGQHLQVEANPIDVVEFRVHGA